MATNIKTLFVFRYDIQVNFTNLKVISKWSSQGFLYQLKIPDVLQLSVINNFVHILAGSFLNCTHSSSHFLGTKSSLMLCQGCRIVTWREEGAGRWIMPPASAWGPAIEHCPRPTSSLNAVGARPYARRYIYLEFTKQRSLHHSFLKVICVHLSPFHLFLYISLTAS